VLLQFLGTNHTAPAIDIILFIEKIIPQPGRERKIADEDGGSQSQLAQISSYPQSTKVFQASWVSCNAFSD
jgi:hypothetical protein